jgi:hypothetical protein
VGGILVVELDRLLAGDIVRIVAEAGTVVEVVPSLDSLDWVGKPYSLLCI